MSPYMDPAEFGRLKTVLLGKERTISVSGQVPHGYSWALYLGAEGEVLYELGDGVYGACPDNARFGALATTLVQAIDNLIDAISEIDFQEP